MSSSSAVGGAIGGAIVCVLVVVAGIVIGAVIMVVIKRKGTKDAPLGNTKLNRTKVLS